MHPMAYFYTFTALCTFLCLIDTARSGHRPLKPADFDAGDWFWCIASAAFWPVILVFLALPKKRARSLWDASSRVLTAISDTLTKEL